MKFGLAHVIALVVCSALPVRAVESGDASVVLGPSLGPAPVGIGAAHVSLDGVGTSHTIDDLIPLGPPIGARDELAVKVAGPASAVPEPATLAVFGVGLLLLFRRRSAA